MTSKYKPTDLVRIKELEEVKGKMHDRGITWIPEMDQYANTVQEIFSVSQMGAYQLKGNASSWFTDSMIAGLAEDCTIITKEPDKVVPPGIVFLMNQETKLRFEVSAHKSYYDSYENAVKYALDKGYTIDTIRENGVEWSVGEVGKMGYDSFRIDSFRWHPESKAWGVHVTDLDPDDAIQPGEVWLGNISKLPPPEEHPEPDKERLEKYVLAAMAAGHGQGSPNESARLVIDYAIAMMKAVDEYKPVTN